ncbi:Glycosyltransferase [hydrothermal vent metagenome]|uniref:Glycosyltransferase n=1 Tax=hydrothermal vent metagenome TaxID=652676 RepID=A0A3B1CNS8_9ZZZZ
MLYYRGKYGIKTPPKNDSLTLDKKVTIQLPVFNEKYVVERLINTVCELDYPKENLEIQVLDDSTDETVDILKRLVKQKRDEGFNIVSLHRDNREGFKAGALSEGLKTAAGEFIAIFDADFIPRKDFLKETLSYFTSDKIGMVQTRWEHLNKDFSLLTKIQAFALNAHFVIEQPVRNNAGFFINFNGTSGVIRKKCIEDAGGWQGDTITEDLDLSYRAQLKEWKFIYLKDYTTPAELPIEMNSLRAQQFRWTKGAIETAKKLLLKVWKSKISLRVKLQSTFHLTNNLVFPFILLVGILNIPIILIKHTGEYDSLFNWMSIFILAFISSYLLYYKAQEEDRQNWFKRILFFPLFLAGSMGLSVNNTKAVFEGMFNFKSEFVRTPKYLSLALKERKVWNEYLPKTAPLLLVTEFLFFLYSLLGVVLSVYLLNLTAFFFNLLFFIGFGIVSVLSLKESLFNKNIISRK